MKKMMTFLLFATCLTGCNVKELEDVNSDNSVVDNSVEEIIEEKEPEYVDDNPIKVGLYIYTNNRRLLAHTYESYWNLYTDVNGFTAYFSNEEEISNGRLQNVWKSLYQNYSNIDNYKIGYHLEFDTIDGHVSKKILKPSDGNEIYDYIQIYLYDDIHQDSAWYSHITDAEITNSTILTTLKVTMSTKMNQITSDIKLTVFTYNSEDDFDEFGMYRGNSSFTTLIKRK